MDGSVRAGRGEKPFGSLINFVEVLAKGLLNGRSLVRFENFRDGKNPRRLDMQKAGALFFREQTEHRWRRDEQGGLKLAEFLRQLLGWFK